MKRHLMAFLRDERGDIVQNIAWIVAVSIGAIVVGGVVYSGIRGFGNKTSTTINNIEPPQPTVKYE